jgi:hypothetical protein
LTKALLLNPVANLSSRVISRRSKARESSPVPGESPERYLETQVSSSAAGPATTNELAFSYETYSSRIDSPTLGQAPYSQASFQDPNTEPTPHHQNHPSVAIPNMSYAQTANYIANGSYEAANADHQQTSSYPARQPRAADSFYPYGGSFTNSLTISDHPAEAEVLEDEYQEHSPQLQTWAFETSDSNMPVNERLVKDNWE